jgi:hypothetical protein
VSVHLSLIEKPRPAAIASLSDPLAAFDKVDARPDAKKTKTLTDVLMIACCGISQLADFHFERTGLYLSLRSQWFLAGQGGACSHWGRRSIDGRREPGEGLRLISQPEARRLLEQHNGPVESFFESEEG